MKNNIFLALAFVFGTTGLFAAENSNDSFIPPVKKTSKEHKLNKETVETKNDIKHTYVIEYRSDKTIEKNLSYKELQNKLRIAAVKNYTYIQPEIIAKE